MVIVAADFWLQMCGSSFDVKKIWKMLVEVGKGCIFGEIIHRLKGRKQ